MNARKKLLLSVFAVLLASLPVEKAIAVDPFIEAGVGMIQSLRTTDDGVWIQDRLPHNVDWTAIAFRGGVGLKLNESWSVQTNYVRFGTGSAVKLQSVWQSDEIYESHCGLSCDHYQGHLWSTMQGGELVGTYHPPLWALSPIIRAGLAGFQHSVNWKIDGDPATHHYRGLVIAGVAGVGACYQQWLCVDTSYYHGFAETAFALSTSAFVYTGSVKYDF